MVSFYPTATFLQKDKRQLFKHFFFVGGGAEVQVHFYFALNVITKFISDLPAMKTINICTSLNNARYIRDTLPGFLVWFLKFFASVPRTRVFVIKVLRDHQVLQLLILATSSFPSQYKYHISVVFPPVQVLPGCIAAVKHGAIQYYWSYQWCWSSAVTPAGRPFVPLLTLMTVRLLDMGFTSAGSIFLWQVYFYCSNIMLFV